MAETRYPGEVGFIVADPDDGTVLIDTWGCGIKHHGEGSAGCTVELTPDEARVEAAALIEAAEYVESGR